MKALRRALACGVAVLGICLLAPSARAAEFTLQPADAFGPVSVLIQGEIKPGDYARFLDFLLLSGHLKAYANYVWLNSRGGDLPEAMKFAALLEKSSASVVVGPDGKCYSACFMLFAAGADRWLYAFGELGVHQIAVTSEQIGKAQRQAIAQRFSSDIKTTLLRQGIPVTLIDKMMDTPTFDMYKIDTLLLKRMGWLRGLAHRPSFLAAVENVCGAQPDLQTANRSSTAPPSMWTACRIDYQIRNTKAFVADELALLEAGQPSVLFAQASLAAARRAVHELMATAAR